MTEYIDATKFRGPKGKVQVPVFYVQTGENRCNIMLSVVENIKRLPKTRQMESCCHNTNFHRRDGKKLDN